LRVAVGVLTHNVYKHDRFDLLRNTLKSLQQTEVPFDCYVVDNHSTDGTEAYVEALGGHLCRDAVFTCGHGMNVTMQILADSGADLCVFSNDDIEWHEGYLEKLTAFWSEAPDDLLVCSGHLEPVYFWNTPRHPITCGGVTALVRDTAPGGTWTFRVKDWPTIGPVPETHGEDDVPTCYRLTQQGYLVAQMDVATHVGEDASTWGNGSYLHAQPLDRKQWGLD
jgi:GT2 family glycosyltransferase